jgi:hypothetical protein
MSTEIVLIGGLLDEPAPAEFIERLQLEVSAEVAWDWVHCTQANVFQPPASLTARVFDRLNSWRSTRKKARSDLKPETLLVVKLYDLHGRTASLLYRAWPEPILAPNTARTSDALVDWLVSPAANLFPPKEWWAGTVQAALVAVLCKLVRNKSWNSSVSGHAWTKEDDLLTQSPVRRDDRPTVAIEARRMLDSLNGRLLLTKGAGQGKTPKEWSIDTQFLPFVKHSILSNSLAPLKVIAALDGLLRRIEQSEQCTFRLDGEIVTERVRAICRTRD